jgi:calcineurin-like phosphoesterase family protein
MIFNTLATVITDDDWITSDHHFGHARIILPEYCNRPFCCKHQMNEILIQKWNSKVGINDRVFYLGDFAWGPKGFRRRILERLNGHIFFVRGNHDKERKFMVELGCHLGCLDIEATYEPSDGPTSSIYMRHLPNFKRAPEFDYHICGHVHDTWARLGNIINASVDVTGFEPAKMADLIKTEQSVLEPIDSELKAKIAEKNRKIKERLYGKDD